MTSSAYKLITAGFDRTPSLDEVAEVVAKDSLSGELDAVGITVGIDGDVPVELGVDREALGRAGFEGKSGQTLVLPQPSGPAIVAVGAGDVSELDASGLRDLAAAFARSTARLARIGLRVASLGGVDAEPAGQAIAEGGVLARYRYNALKQEPKDTALALLELQIDGADAAALASGIVTGLVEARAANLARDLANTPPSHLTATDLGEVAIALGERFGFAVEVFDKEQIIAMGCGGLLGVNAGSVEEPRMIKLSYRSDAPSSPHLAFVGKGIMYDSGGISLKPSDPMHLAMKMDMGGAAAVLAAMTSLRDLDCPTSVTAFLSCTDNMPSGSAYKLGDVLNIRGGKTVEVKNTDAEGRLVMSDALVLATEESPDAIVDIATLTGAALMALGPLTAALLGNDQALVDQLAAAAERTDEQAWQLPLERKYRKQLDSEVADMSNLGGPYAGATTAALFLDEFVAGLPWAHLDIAGTMQAEADDSWRSKGATGYGARLLTELALSFAPVR